MYTVTIWDNDCHDYETAERATLAEAMLVAWKLVVANRRNDGTKYWRAIVQGPMIPNIRIVADDDCYTF
jgi:hypothetical protein